MSSVGINYSFSFCLFKASRQALQYTCGMLGCNCTISTLTKVAFAGIKIRFFFDKVTRGYNIWPSFLHDWFQLILKKHLNLFVGVLQLEIPGLLGYYQVVAFLNW